MKRLFVFVWLCVFLISSKAFAIDISAECACLLNAETGEVLYEYNGYSRHSIASTTKIMTAILAIENSEPDEVVTVSKNAQMQEGSSIYLKSGDRVLMKDLVMGMMLNSGNDAACAVAEHIGGTSEEFAVMMNKKAQEIGLSETSFKNANGLDADGHYSTAYDMAQIGAYALKNEEFRRIVSTKNSRLETDGYITYLKNHNKLLWNYDGCIGIKTGYTKKTGRCLVSAAQRGEVTLVAVTLNAPDDWNDHKKMLDYGFENLKTEKIISMGEIFKSYSGKNEVLNAVSAEDVYLSCFDKSKVNVVLHTVEEIKHSVIKGEKIGYMEIFYGNKPIKCIDLVADRDFSEFVGHKTGFFGELMKIIKKLLIIG